MIRRILTALLVPTTTAEEQLADIHKALEPIAKGFEDHRSAAYMVRKIVQDRSITDRLDHVLEQLGDLDVAVADIDGDAWTELAAVQVALGKHYTGSVVDGVKGVVAMLEAPRASLANYVATLADIRDALGRHAHPQFTTVENVRGLVVAYEGEREQTSLAHQAAGEVSAEMGAEIQRLKAKLDEVESALNVDLDVANARHECLANAIQEALGDHATPGQTLAKDVAALASAYSSVSRNLTAAMERVNSQRAEVLAEYLRTEDMDTKVAKLEADLSACAAECNRLSHRLQSERNCGQDDVCVTAPGCARHWQERNRELAADRDRLKAELDLLRDRVGAANGLSTMLERVQAQRDQLDAALTDAQTERDALAAQLEDREDDNLTLLAIREKLTDYVVEHRLAGQKLQVVVDHVLADAREAAYYRAHVDIDKMHAALFGAGIKGGPGAWRWYSDPMGTTFGTVAAFCRLMLTRLDIGDAPEEERAPDLADANANAIAAVDRGLDLRAAGWHCSPDAGWTKGLDGEYMSIADAHAIMLADRAKAPTLAAIATPKSAEEVVREAVAEAHAADDLAAFEKGLLSIKVTPRDTLADPEPGDLYVDRDGDPWLCCRDKRLLTFTSDDITGTAEAYKLRPARPEEAAKIRKDNGL